MRDPVCMTVNRRLGIALAVVLFAAVVASAASSSWRTPTRDPASPEGVVQQYLTAVLHHRSDDAAAFLASDSACSANDFDVAYVGDDPSADLASVVVTGANARVSVHIAFGSGDPFGDTYGEDHTFRLVGGEGAWRITGIPWPLYSCGKAVAP